MIVLDTNVLSELMKDIPDPRVSRRLSAVPMMRVFTTSICEAEIRLGVEQMPAGRRLDAFRVVMDALFGSRFAGRVLAFDSVAAGHFARIVATRNAGGRPMTPMDAQIAAIAAANDMAIATRNVRDFEGCGVELIDPWAG